MSFWTPEGSKGVSCAVDGKYLILKFSLKGDFGASSSGKTECVAGCNSPLGKTGLKINLNCWRKLGSKIPKDDVLESLKQPDGMENIKANLSDGTISLKIDTTEEGKEAASGKNILLATTRCPRKLGDTGCTMNINVYHAPGAEIDMSKVQALDFGTNITPSVSEDKSTLTMIVDTDSKPTKSNKTYMLASTQGSKKIGDGVHTATINIFCKEKEIDIPVVPTPMDVNEKSRGFQYTHDGKKLKIIVELNGNPVTSSSGLSLVVASSTGQIADTNVTLSGSVYKKNPDSKEAAKSAAEKDKTKSKRSTVPTYSVVKKAVAKAMDTLDEDSLTRGAIRKHVAKKNGWDNDAELKKLVSKAITSLEEDEPPSDNDEEGEVKRRKNE
eukprot:TRINITY_DN31583_c0_g1_i1.p1 TRINITY_DN31583_c0_g1~~TRINITY_DN31583_c0_g1_i1.p1  ORF type:complete len:405 (+),score=72.52 TRINITY_DN31583_c0_g1_i1:65-1216(+)